MSEIQQKVSVVRPAEKLEEFIRLFSSNPSNTMAKGIKGNFLAWMPELTGLLEDLSEKIAEKNIKRINLLKKEIIALIESGKGKSEKESLVSTQEETIRRIKFSPPIVGSGDIFENLQDGTVRLGGKFTQEKGDFLDDILLARGHKL